MKKAVRLILFSFGLLLLFFLIYQVGFYEIIKTIVRAKLKIAFLGVCFYIVLIFTRSLKWFILVRILKNEIKYKELLPLYLINSLMGNVTPFKAGETATPFLFKKYLKIPVGQGFSVIILDRFFEMMVLTVISSLAVLYMLNSGESNSLILFTLQGVLISLFLLLAIFIIVVASKRITLRILRLFIFLKKYPVAKGGLEFIEKELNIFYTSLSLFKDKRAYQFVVPLTLLSWFFEILAFYLVFSSVISVPFIKIAVSQIIAMAAAFITFIPGGVGMAEISVVSILGLFGYPSLLTISGVLLVRLFLTGTLLISGLIGLLLIKKRA